MSNSRKVKKTKPQLQETLDAAKATAQRTYNRTVYQVQKELEHTQEVAKDKLGEVDLWAIDLANNAIDRAVEKLDRVKEAAKQKLDETIEQAQNSAKQKAKQVERETGKTAGKMGDRLKRAARSAWKNLID